MNVVILGCGRVGATLARQLSKQQHHVTVIDLTGDSFRRLGIKYPGKKVIGNGLDQDVLRRAGLEKADAFFALTQGDNTNIMAAQVAKHVFDVAKVLIRIYDPIRADAYRELGYTTICTTTIAAGLFQAAITEDDTYEECLEALGTLNTTAGAVSA